jgi:hypothetical protein
MVAVDIDEVVAAQDGVRGGEDGIGASGALNRGVHS